MSWHYHGDYIKKLLWRSQQSNVSLPMAVIPPLYFKTFMYTMYVCWIDVCHTTTIHGFSYNQSINCQQFTSNLICWVVDKGSASESSDWQVHIILFPKIQPTTNCWFELTLDKNKVKTQRRIGTSLLSTLVWTPCLALSTYLNFF